MWIDTYYAYANATLYGIDIAGEWDGRDFPQVSVTATVQEFVQPPNIDSVIPAHQFTNLGNL